MKIRVVYILMGAAILGIGASYRAKYVKKHQQSDDLDLSQIHSDMAGKKDKEPKQNTSLEPTMVQDPSPSEEKDMTPIIVKAPVPEVDTPAPSTQAPVYDQATVQHWNRMAKRFSQHLDQLSRETDSTKRLNLIQAIARNVRVDTPRTLEWAMSLEDPHEKRVAMEAINKNALTGIGARLLPDETGVPRVTQTTEFGAAATSGRIEPGDYITGKMNADGSIDYFKGWPLNEIVMALRGKAGTEIRLLIERVPIDGSEPYSFDVPLKRSMIVVEPLY